MSAHVTVTFVCGHQAAVHSAKTPRCACGETRVRTVQAPAPRFRGVATGPSVTRAALEAIPVAMGDPTPLFRPKE